MPLLLWGVAHNAFEDERNRNVITSVCWKPVFQCSRIRSFISQKMEILWLLQSKTFYCLLSGTGSGLRSCIRIHWLIWIEHIYIEPVSEHTTQRSVFLSIRCWLNLTVFKNFHIKINLKVGMNKTRTVGQTISSLTHKSYTFGDAS